MPRLDSPSAPDDPGAPPPPTRPPTAPAAAGATQLDEAARRAPIHERDRAPGFLLHTQAWFGSWLSSESRLVLGLVIVGLAIVLAAVFSSFQILRILFDALDILAFIGLFLVNWVGNGGILVPVPGARLVGLLMVFQRAAVSPSWEVFAVGGAAMALGLLSYYIAGARIAQSYAEGDTEAAEQLALDTGMLDDAPGVTPDAPPGPGAPGAPTSTPGRETGMGRLLKRFQASLKEAQQRAEPVIERRGMSGMFLLCFAPTPLGTAAAFVGGVIRFGFARYLAASFSAKYLLTGIIVLAALLFSGTASAVEMPSIELPFLD